MLKIEHRCGNIVTLSGYVRILAGIQRSRPHTCIIAQSRANTTPHHTTAQSILANEVIRLLTLQFQKNHDKPWDTQTTSSCMLLLTKINNNMIQFSSLWCSRGIGVGSTSAAKRSHNIDKATVVLHPSLGTTSLLLLLLLGINLEGRGRERGRERENTSRTHNFLSAPPLPLVFVP